MIILDNLMGAISGLVILFFVALSGIYLYNTIDINTSITSNQRYELSQQKIAAELELENNKLFYTSMQNMLTTITTYGTIIIVSILIVFSAIKGLTIITKYRDNRDTKQMIIYQNAIHKFGENEWSILNSYADKNNSTIEPEIVNGEYYYYLVDNENKKKLITSG